MRISEALGTTTSKLNKQGVADSFLGIDSRLHIDPALLRTTRVPEFTKSAERFEGYFSKIMLTIAGSTPGGPLESQIISLLTFPEVSAAALGFSEASSRGRGVSRKLATQLYHTARELLNIGIKDPAIFELLVLFEEGFGPDLISDMALWVVLDDVGEFNARVCRNLGVATGTLSIEKRQVIVAHSTVTTSDILLLPKTLLSDLPIAQSSKDIDRIAHYNAKVREDLNKWLGKSWSNLAKRLSKHDLKDLLIKNPKLLLDLITEYKKHRAVPYDFDSDPLGEIVWNDIGTEFAKAHPVSLKPVANEDELRVVIQKILAQFKRLIENNGLWRHLYTDSGKQRSEKFSQLLFLAVADSYCKANNLDLSAEPNAGRGPVDFKISHGYDARAVVEVKLSSNGAALEGLLAQLPTYAVTEQAAISFYLLVVVGKSRSKVDSIKKEHRRLIKRGSKLPELVVVEAFAASKAASASKLRGFHRSLDDLWS